MSTLVNRLNLYITTLTLSTTSSPYIALISAGLVLASSYCLMARRPDTLFWEGWAIPQQTSETTSLRNLGFQAAPDACPAACGLLSSGTLEEAQAINLRLMVDLELEKQRLVSLCNLQDHENEASVLLSDELGKLLEAKSKLVSENMRLERENKLLWVERVLICEVLECDTSEGNLCGVLEDELKKSRRVTQLEALLASSQAELDRLTESLASFQSEHDALLEACTTLDSIALDGNRCHSTSCAAPSLVSEVDPSTLATLAAIIRTAIKKGDDSFNRRTLEQHCPHPPCEDSSPTEILLDLLQLRRLSDVGSGGSESSLGSSTVAEVPSGSVSVPQQDITSLLLRQDSTPQLSPKSPASTAGSSQPVNHSPSCLVKESHKHSSSDSGTQDLVMRLSDSGTPVDALKACRLPRSRETSETSRARQVPSFAG